MRSRTIVPTAAALLLAADAWSCDGGGSSSNTPAGPSPVAGSGAAVITISSNNGARSFAPNPAAFGGQLVTFRNADAVVHRVTLNDGSLDTGDIPPGGSSQPLMMPASGTNYHCSLHPTMIGSVGTPTAPPPPCTGLYC
jgi:plastocyanin